MPAAGHAERTILVGYASTDEACTHFVHAWPAHALESGVGVESARVR